MKVDVSVQVQGPLTKLSKTVPGDTFVFANYGDANAVHLRTTNTAVTPEGSFAFVTLATGSPSYGNDTTDIILVPYKAVQVTV